MFREELDLRLARGLGDQLVAPPQDRDREARREFVIARIAVEDFRVDGNLFLGRGERPGSY